MKTLLRLGALLLALASPAAAQPVGAPLPPLRLPTIEGKTFDLRSLRGSKVLLIEFASW